MAWTIYSVGDGKFLEQILNGVAMIAGTGDLSTLAGIGMLVGLIMLGFKSIMNGGQGIQFQVFLVNYIIFMAMFGGKVTVVIDDVYNNKQHVVANVPQGIGIAGSIVSKIGFRTTELFEQGFSYVRMTDEGFASALKALSTLRQATMTKAGIGTVNAMGTNGDLWRSWSNYIKECTLVGVDLKQYTIDDIKKNKRFPGSSSLEQLRFSSNSYGTEIYITSVPEVGGCNQMFDRLADVTPDIVSNAGLLMDQLKGQLGVETAFDASEQINKALFAIGQSGVQTQQYMVTTLLEPIFNWATIENEFSAQKAAAATMLHSSIQQRNAQWAAEQALFQTTVRPMMTFFEGLVYAITPIMAFLIGLGPMGFGLIGKYLLIMIWIQLWMPTLAIINLYMNMSLTRSFNALTQGSTGVELASFYGIQAADQELQSWIATGGMLAAAVPGITLMLVYGSAVTATSLAGRMASGAVDVDNMSPSVLKNGPAHENSSQTIYNPTSGHQTTGAQAIQKTLTMGSGHGNAISSMSSTLQQQQQQLARKLSEDLQTSGMSQKEIGQAISHRLSEMGSSSETYQAALSYGRAITQGTELGQNASENDLASIGAQAALSARGDVSGGTGKNGASGSVGGQASAGVDIKSMFGKQYTISDKDAAQIQDNISRNEGKAAEFTRAVAKDQSRTSGEKFITSDLFSNSSELSSQASKLHQSAESYSKAKTYQGQMGSNWSMNHTELSGRLQSNPEIREAIADYMEKWGDQGGLLAMANMEARALDMDPTTRAFGLSGDLGSMYAIASGQFLSGISDPEARADAAIQAQELMAKLSGFTIGDTDAYANDTIPTVDASSADEAANISGPSRSRSDIEGDRDDIAQGPFSVTPRDRFEQGRREVWAAEDYYEKQFNYKNNERINREFPERAEDVNERLKRTGFVPGGLNMAGTGLLASLGDILNRNNDFKSTAAPDGKLGNLEDFNNLEPTAFDEIYKNTFEGLYDKFWSEGMNREDALYAAANQAPAAIGYLFSETSLTDAGYPEYIKQRVESSDIHQDALREANAQIDRALDHLEPTNRAMYKDSVANIGDAMLQLSYGDDTSGRLINDTYNLLEQSGRTIGGNYDGMPREHDRGGNNGNGNIWQDQEMDGLTVVHVTKGGGS